MSLTHFSIALVTLFPLNLVETNWKNEDAVLCMPLLSALLAMLDKYHVPIESRYRLRLLFGVLLVLPWHPAWRIQQLIIE